MNTQKSNSSSCFNPIVTAVHGAPKKLDYRRGEQCSPDYICCPIITSLPLPMGVIPLIGEMSAKQTKGSGRDFVEPYGVSEADGEGHKAPPPGELSRSD